MTVKADVRDRALRLLGSLGAGETASAEDAADVDAIYTSLYAELIQENLAVWGSGASDAIPEQYVEPLVRVVAARSAPGFSVSTINGLSPEGLEEIALGRLRRMISPDPSGRRVKAEYF